MVEYARQHYARQLARLDALEGEGSHAPVLDPDILTLGFARRFATYKRPALLLHDPERLVHILTNSSFPVQLIIAGKAHPADLAGQDMIRQWIQFTRRPEVYGRVVFLSDYDMLLTERLVAGVDVWINNPRRPMEACGTSGMKILVNGGLNLSVLDGWWAEAYNSQVGWALGDAREHGDDPDWDARDADSLYTLLENEVIPQFYARGADGIPKQWIAKMRESMSELTVLYSANRSVRQYTEEYYLPAAAAYEARSASGGALGAKIESWGRGLAANWGMIKFGEMRVETHDGQHRIEILVDLGSIDPESVAVELYADVPEGTDIRQKMDRSEKVTGGSNGFVYGTHVAASRPASDFTPRVIPQFQGVAVPLETNLILWHH